MFKFEKGDKVRMLKECLELIKGEIVTIDEDNSFCPFITKTDSDGRRMCVHQSHAELVEEELTNKTNNKITSIKETLKRLTLTKPEKQFVEAGLMYTDKSWEAEAKDFAREQMLESHMATKEFKDELLKVAEARIADSK